MENEYSAQNFRSKRIHHAIEISAQMFLRDGIESVKMTDIADECGIGVATLYRYFGTKTGIGSYFEPEINGGTVLSINENGVRSVCHEYVDISELL